MEGDISAATVTCNTLHCYVLLYPSATEITDVSTHSHHNRLYNSVAGHVCN